MKLWILSDLHLDVDRGWQLPANPPEHDIMIVAGDLITRMERGVRWLRARVSEGAVIYVMGNHEPYGTDIDRTLAKARAAADGTNIHVLENDVRIIDGVRFLGTTLWTDFALRGNAESGKATAASDMTDYKRIRVDCYARRLRPHHTLARHTKARAFITTELARPFAGPTAVVTHHAADPLAIVAQADEDVAPAYASDLSDTIKQFSPTLWIHGHIHRSADRMVGGTRMVANPKGYPPPYHNPNFDPFFTVEIC